MSHPQEVEVVDSTRSGTPYQEHHVVRLGGPYLHDPNSWKCAAYTVHGERNVALMHLSRRDCCTLITGRLVPFNITLPSQLLF